MRRRGLTLIELLVVLAILAVLATIAVTSADALLSQGRYEATQRTLTNIEEAVLGPANARQPDGTILVSSFVADMGRLPKAVDSGTPTDPRLGLDELWFKPASALAFDIRSPTYDPEVLVPCGWRGPYLRLPVGQNDVRDGWGVRLLDLLDDTDNLLASSGSLIYKVRSRGADGAVDPIPPVGIGGYDKDLVVTFVNRWQMTASGQVSVNDPQPTTQMYIIVMLYEPNADSTTGMLQPPQNRTSSIGSYSFNYSFTTTVGPRFLRAYLVEPPDGKYWDPTNKKKMPNARASDIVQFQQGAVIPLVIK